MATERTRSENWVVETFTGGNRWKVNAYLVTCRRTSRSFLVDPGSEPSDLTQALRASGQAIRLVVLTHGHFDHMLSAHRICEEFGIPCVVHPADVRLLRHAPFYAISFDRTLLSVPRDVVTLDQGAVSDLPGWAVKVLHTPGHTPGGVCLVADRFVLTGDTLLREAVGRTDQPGGDRATLARSVDHMLACTPSDGMILPGHGPAWTVAEARKWWSEVSQSPPQFDDFG